MQRIGFIGLGIMGKPMARNLLRAGYPLVVHNRSRGAVDSLAAEGAQAASNPREVAEGSDVVITMLPDTPDVQSVALGADGILSGARPGLTHIDMSTILPQAGREVAAALAERGAEMLDAPVSGGPQGAAEGTLSIMVGGSRATFETCRPILEVMGRTIVYMGDHGAGHTAKLCNQVACVLNLLGVCEMLVLGGKAGLDLNRVIEAVGAGLGSSAIRTNHGPKMLARDFSPGFFVRLQQKDLRLALATAEELGVPLAGTALVQQLLRTLEAEGKGEQGTQALVRVIERLAGCEVKAE